MYIGIIKTDKKCSSEILLNPVHTVFLQAKSPSCYLTDSVKSLK